MNGGTLIALHPHCDWYHSFNFQTELCVVFELAIVPAGVETQVFKLEVSKDKKVHLEPKTDVRYRSHKSLYET